MPLLSRADGEDLCELLVRKRTGAHTTEQADDAMGWYRFANVPNHVGDAGKAGGNPLASVVGVRTLANVNEIGKLF